MRRTAGCSACAGTSVRLWGRLGVVDLASLVLRNGSIARAVGRVVAFDGEVWFEPPLPVRLVAYAPGQEPPPRPTGAGVLTRGVDLDQLSRRREKDAAVEGWAALAGVWRDQHPRVTEQRAEEPHGKDRTPRWAYPALPETAQRVAARGSRVEPRTATI